MAEGEGFEPPVPFRVQRFSRPPVSTAHASLRKDKPPLMAQAGIFSYGLAGVLPTKDSIQFYMGARFRDKPPFPSVSAEARDLCGSGRRG